MRRLIRPTIVIIALACVCVVPALAGAPTDQLRTSIDQVIRTVQDPGLKTDANADKRRTAIRAIASTIFDFGEAARRSLGRHWQRLPETDRQEFVSLFAGLLERSYVGKIEQYSGERIVYAGDSIDSDAATVRTRFVTRNGTEIPVDYRLLRQGERWLVYDVSVEGLSLVANYRSQFNRIIETSSYQDLVRRMKARSDDFGAPSASGAKKS